ncbi:Na+/H+ antiporter subunit G [Halopseudomonas phragmitis]|uniref:Na+/H+ antiporter subunit G n=2 Tax=Pseudomonadaceae TaxID=135621 RepID=A0A1V0B4W2_9GAMM|nr:MULTISPECIES: Na+/H+ antiporter subunit G [Pseudomonadaceae]AQZ94972.1 Na+/H+ antiporter subunit G [Halopseudomonas phragmitis]PAU87749.1 Na+/H+ antiporter subunit G [Pseudomonas sp. WN033]RHW23133.1 Na+/H+ antiporter subunit G [Pseudomonas jilinensis]
MLEATWIEWLVAALILLGSLFALIGSIGLWKLPDFFMRLHGPTKATTLGVGALVIGSLLYFSTRGEGLSLHELLITIFLFMTAPVSAHMLAKAAMHEKLKRVERTRGEPWDQ